MENTKIKANLNSKIRFIVTTYAVTIVLWICAVYLVAYLTPSLKTVHFFDTIANIDIYKIVILFLVFFTIGNYLDKLPSKTNWAILSLRFIIIVIIMVSINIRWDIDISDASYFNVMYIVTMLLVLSQAIRIGLLLISDNINTNFKRLNEISAYVFGLVILSIVVYLVFTIAERQNKHATILSIDKFLISYLKYPLLVLIFMADYAFSTSRPYAKGLPYGLYSVSISEPLKGASFRLRFLLFVYLIVSGFVLSQNMWRPVFN